LDERLVQVQIAAMLLVVGGASLAQWRKRTKASPRLGPPTLEGR